MLPELTEAAVQVHRKISSVAISGELCSLLPSPTPTAVLARSHRGNGVWVCHYELCGCQALATHGIRKLRGWGLAVCFDYGSNRGVTNLKGSNWRYAPTKQKQSINRCNQIQLHTRETTLNPNTPLVTRSYISLLRQGRNNSAETKQFDFADHTVHTSTTTAQ